AVTGGDESHDESGELGDDIARAFVAGRFADVYAMGTEELRRATSAERFETSWRDAVRDRGPLTGFEVSNAGEIDLGFIPGLEEVPQARLVAFLQIAFSSPQVALGDDNAFTIGVVLLEDGGKTHIGPLHAP